MIVSFEKASLFLNGEMIKEFDYPIKEVVDFPKKKVIVVLIDRDYYKRDNENVFCVNLEGQVIWQVPEYEFTYERSPYVEIGKLEDNVKLWNWDSSYVIMEPKTGKILVTPRESRKGRRAW